MKKILLSLLICFFITSKAEDKYNISMLIGTKWTKVTNQNVYTIEFSDTTISGNIVFPRLNRTVNFQWPYYLTENYIKDFNNSLVGHSENGIYINHYNPDLEETFSERIVTLCEDSLVLFYEVKEDYIGGRNHTITYRRVK